MTSQEGPCQVYDDMYKFLLVSNFGGRSIKKGGNAPRATDLP